MKHGKKYTEAAKQVDRAVAYEPADAVALAKKTAVAKFDETIEVHIRTGCDGRHADQQIRGAVVLPHGTGKTVRILVFAKGPKAEEAQAAGADFVGAEELIPKIQNEGWLDFDVVEIGALTGSVPARDSIHLESFHLKPRISAVTEAVPGRYSAENAYGSALNKIVPVCVVMANL